MKQAQRGFQKDALDLRYNSTGKRIFAGVESECNNNNNKVLIFAGKHYVSDATGGASFCELLLLSQIVPMYFDP
jgi:hypothetical protein